MNNVVLIGRLVRDPELKFIPSTGMAITNFTLAIDKDLSKDKKEEFASQGKPTADFIRVVVYGKMAEACANYLVKGRKTAVMGRINTGSYTKEDGSKVFTTDVMATKVEFIDWGDQEQPQQKQQAPQKQVKKNTPVKKADLEGTPFEFDFEDVTDSIDGSDIPF